MDIEAKIFRQYRFMKSEMSCCVFDSNASIRYHLMADAIYWTDEIPENLNSFSKNCLRFVLRYRTTLLINEPDYQWKRHWETAKIDFPNWIGFRGERSSPSEVLKNIYIDLRTEGDRSIG